MHDLTKITSRKSTTKVITFYFRVPTYQEYQQSEQLLEFELVTNLFQKPQTNYTFAFKRQTFEDVSMSFMFDNEDQAKSCI
jgi:hypothetical protein